MDRNNEIRVINSCASKFSNIKEYGDGLYLLVCLESDKQHNWTVFRHLNSKLPAGL